MKYLNQKGVVDVTVAVMVLVLIGVIGFTVWRVTSNNNQVARDTELESSELSDALPENLDNIKTLEEIEQIAGVTDDNQIIRFELETEDSGVIYKIILSDGTKLTIDGETGEVLSREMTDVSDDDKLPAGFTLSMSPSEAYQKASELSDSRVKKIEMEVEDNGVVYKVEFMDGSKVELDAGTGVILKQEIKDGDEREDDDSDREDEDEEEDDSDDEDEDEDEEEDDSDDDEDEDEDEEEDDR